MTTHNPDSEEFEDDLASDSGDSSSAGYKCPPHHRGFKKGRSGNPAGRPKGRSSMSKLLKSLLNDSVPIRLDGQTHFMSKAEAMIRIQVSKARRGDTRALATLVKLLDMAGRFDEPSDEERKKYGVVAVPEKLTQDEWDILYDPDLEDERQRYLAMATLPEEIPPTGDFKFDAYIRQLATGDVQREQDDLDGALDSYCEALNIARHGSWASAARHEISTYRATWSARWRCFRPLGLSAAIPIAGLSRDG